MDEREKERLIAEENRRMRRMRFVVDLAQAVLMQSDLRMEEALKIMDDTKKAVLNLFPGKEDVYELIHTPRFRRILHERFSVRGSAFGRN